MVVKKWLIDPQLNCMPLLLYMKVDYVEDNYDLNENSADFFE
jgi:hypothetical protein